MTFERVNDMRAAAEHTTIVCECLFDIVFCPAKLIKRPIFVRNANPMMISSTAALISLHLPNRCMNLIEPNPKRRTIFQQMQSR